MLVSVIPVVLFVTKDEDDDGVCNKDIDEVVSVVDGTLPKLEDRFLRPMILIFGGWNGMNWYLIVQSFR